MSLVQRSVLDSVIGSLHGTVLGQRGRGATFVSDPISFRRTSIRRAHVSFSRFSLVSETNCDGKQKKAPKKRQNGRYRFHTAAQNDYLEPYV